MSLKYNIQNNNLSLEECKKSISQILHVIFTLEGKVFGGFVRDYMVPLEKQDPVSELQARINGCRDNPVFQKGFPDSKTIIDKNDTAYRKQYIDFKDIDVWFTTIRQKDIFLDLLKILNMSLSHNNDEYTMKKQNTLSDKPETNTGSNITGFHRSYPFKVFRYHLTMDNKFQSFIDIVVSDYFPVNDFSVNLLSYDGRQLQVEKYCEILNIVDAKPCDIQLSVHDIMKQIIDNTSIMLPDFQQISKNKNDIYTIYSTYDSLFINLMCVRCKKYEQNYTIQSFKKQKL